MGVTVDAVDLAVVVAVGVVDLAVGVLVDLAVDFVVGVFNFPLARPGECA